MHLLCHGLSVEAKAPKTSEEVASEVRKLLRLEDMPDVKILYKANEDEVVRFAIMRFIDDKASAQFYHRNKDLKILHPRQIAALIAPEDVAKKVPEALVPLTKDVRALILGQAFNSDQEREDFKLLAGLTDEAKVESLA